MKLNRVGCGSGGVNRKKLRRCIGGESNLVQCRQNHWTIRNFNPEQQGEIARYYYDCQRPTNAIDEPNKQNALSAYKPYIGDIQTTR